MTMIRAPHGVAFVGDDPAGTPIVTLAGELDLAAKPALLAALRTAAKRSQGGIVLDLWAVSFLDSGGCAAIAQGCKEATRAGLRVAVRAEMTRTVRLVLAATGVFQVVEPAWHPSLPDAG